MKHAPEYNKHVRRQVCQKCGLVYLRNKASERAVRAACPGSEKEDGE